MHLFEQELAVVSGRAVSGEVADVPETASGTRQGVAPQQKSLYPVWGWCAIFRAPFLFFPNFLHLALTSLLHTPSLVRHWLIPSRPCEPRDLLLPLMAGRSRDGIFGFLANAFFETLVRFKKSACGALRRTWSRPFLPSGPVSFSPYLANSPCGSMRSDFSAAARSPAEGSGKERLANKKRHRGASGAEQ